MENSTESHEFEVLIVEDSLTQAAQLQFILKDNKYKVRHAVNGEDALKAIRDDQPDLIISDIVMPGMDGYKFCSIVKADALMKKIPVILLTSLSDPKDVIRGLECGADSFLVKPYSEAFLISRIHYFIQNSALRLNHSVDSALEIMFSNEKYSIHSSPRQILDILLSTYENSVLKNQELIASNKNLKIAQDNLTRLNASLEQKIQIRTRELERSNESLLEEIVGHKRTEQSLKESEASLREVNAMKDKFYSIISHDLKSPFNTILGFSELLVEKVKENDFSGIEQYAGIIQNSSQRAVSLLTNLLEWSRAQSGRMEFTPDNVDIILLINEVTVLLIDSARNKLITINKELPNIATAYADVSMISTILRNLISNAIKFTHTGGEIIISAEQKQHEIIVSVADNGVGMDEDARGKLFRIDQSYSTKGTGNELGTGLGLLLCKEFIEKHSGKIWVESEVGKGSKFYFTLKNSQSTILNF